MRRYEIIKDEVYQILNTNCFGNKRKHGLEHLFSVAAMMKYLAIQNNLNIEIAATIGILHDLATYKLNSSFDHANRSSLIDSELLKKDELFSANEIDTIVTAIKNHSNKERIDDKYSELIKNADLLIQYLNDPEALLTSEKQKRINRLIESK